MGACGREEHLFQVGQMLPRSPGGDSADCSASPDVKPRQVFPVTRSGSVLWATSCRLTEDTPVALELNGRRELPPRGRSISLSRLSDYAVEVGSPCLTAPAHYSELCSADVFMAA